MIKLALAVIFVVVSISNAAFAAKSFSKQVSGHRRPADSGLTLPKSFEKGIYVLAGKLKMNQSGQTFIYLYPGTETEVAVFLEDGLPLEDSFLLDDSFYKIKVQFFKQAPPSEAQGHFLQSTAMIDRDDALREAWKKEK